MFEQTFKNIDDILHKDAGCTSELDYTEQSSWLLFLKYLDALEHDKAAEAELEGKRYSFIVDTAYRWDNWAAPKTADGKLDHNAAMTGDDLREFVNGRLFPYLAGFKQRASGTSTIEYKIGEVFSEIKNKLQSGYTLRDVIDRVDELRFGSQSQKHELSHLYEAKIKNMGNAGRNGGEYYTPRPLIRAMIKVLDPKIGERIYDGACGSAGFLCEAFDHLLPQATKADDLKTLQTRTFYGREKKSLAYVIAIMNMILHGIEAPNVVHANTLADNLSDIQERDRYDVILANPPFGGKERKRGSAELSHQDGRDGVPVLAALHQVPAGRWACGHRHQEHVPEQHRLCIHQHPQAAAGKLQVAHGAGHARRHLSRRRRQDRGAVLREGRAHAQGLVLSTEPGSQHGQDQPAERRRHGRFR